MVWMLSLNWSPECDQQVERPFVPVEQYLGVPIGDRSEVELAHSIKPRSTGKNKNIMSLIDISMRKIFCKNTIILHWGLNMFWKRFCEIYLREIEIDKERDLI